VPRTAVIEAVAGFASREPARGSPTGPYTQSNGPVESSTKKSRAGLLVAGLALVAVIAIAIVVGVRSPHSTSVGSTSAVRKQSANAAPTGASTGVATDDTPPSEVDPGSAEETLIEGIPAPAGTELMSSMPQALTLRTMLEPAAVLVFYRRAGRSWGSFKEIPNGLQFENPKAPVTYLTISRMAGGTVISFIRNALVAPPKSDKARRFLGVLIPPEAQATIETPTEAVFQISGPVDNVVTFFRKQLAGKPGVTWVETDVDGSPYFVVSVENHKLPFGHLAVTKTPDALKPASGDWVQISIGK